MAEDIHFKLGPELTFNSVLSERTKIYKAIKNSKGKRLCLDLSDVIHCDSAGMALLIEIRKLCKLRNKIFDTMGISEETRSLAKFCGIEGILTRQL